MVSLNALMEVMKTEECGEKLKLIVYVMSGALLLISDGTRVPDPGLKPGFPFEWVRFFSLKTQVPGFPIFKILRPKNAQISTKYSLI